MEKVAIIAKITAAEGKRDELVDVLSSMFDAVAGEDKTEVYALHLDSADPNVVWFYELYTDSDGLKTHSSSEAMKANGSRLAPLMGGRPEISIVNPVRAKGLSVG